MGLIVWARELYCSPPLHWNSPSGFQIEVQTLNPEGEGEKEDFVENDKVRDQAEVASDEFCWQLRGLKVPA